MFERAQGVYLFDTEGKRYLDGVSSLWCNVHGHRVEALDEAVRAQLGRMAHSTLLGNLHPGAVELARRLSRLAPGELNRVFFSDSGSEAVEVALKIAYQYWHNRGDDRRTMFLSFRNAYHGDTIGAVSVGGVDLFHASYRALLFQALFAPSPYCYRCPFDLVKGECGMRCLERFKQLAGENAPRIAAVVIEPAVQAAAGMIVQPEGFFEGVAETCRRLGLLLIADEVAVGFGRTGDLFASAGRSVAPDLLALAKGITGGYLPLSATLATEEIFIAFLGLPSEAKTFFHGHTYAGNPLAVAAALANLDLFADGSLMAHVRSLATGLATMLECMRELPLVGDIRQVGLMAGIELVKDKRSKEPFAVDRRIGFEVAMAARRLGVFIRPLGDVIVLMPPLAISAAELRTLVEAVGESIREVGDLP
jgi:adenosylmethionine-8-amino-7-oxononanoate aminotransferase